MATASNYSRSRIVTEFEVLTLDKYGDVIDIFHCADCTSAKRQADQRPDDPACVALVIEKHTAHVTEEGFIRGRDSYETIETRGNQTALKAGGWIA